MEIYLDTSNIEEIQKANSLGILDGITTNPTLIAREGKDFNKSLKEIITILKKSKKYFTISVEVINTNTSKDIIKEARELVKIDKHIVVKIPITKEGLTAVSILSKEEINCNMTLCFSANQALLAAKAGAKFVSPFIGRINDEGYNGIDLIKDIKQIYNNYNFSTKILAASIRSPCDVLECSKIGADIAT
ncbi:MAG: transaldolase family protein, partial [Nanoarchaeota archaeon]